MKENPFFIAAALFCLAASALAADGKQKQPEQPQATEQAQMAQQPVAEASKEQPSASGDCAGKTKKHKQRQEQQPRDPETGLELWQAQQIYGGGG